MKNRLHYSCYYKLINYFYNYVVSNISSSVINGVEPNVSCAVNTGVTRNLRHALLRSIKDNLATVIRNI